MQAAGVVAYSVRAMNCCFGFVEYFEQYALDLHLELHLVVFQLVFPAKMQFKIVISLCDQRSYPQLILLMFYLLLTLLVLSMASLLSRK